MQGIGTRSPAHRVKIVQWLCTHHSSARIINRAPAGSSPVEAPINTKNTSRSPSVVTTTSRPARPQGTPPAGHRDGFHRTRAVNQPPRGSIYDACRATALFLPCVQGIGTSDQMFRSPAHRVKIVQWLCTHHKSMHYFYPVCRGSEPDPLHTG